MSYEADKAISELKKVVQILARLAVAGGNVTWDRAAEIKAACPWIDLNLKVPGEEDDVP